MKTRRSIGISLLVVALVLVLAASGVGLAPWNVDSTGLAAPAAQQQVVKGARVISKVVQTIQPQQLTAVSFDTVVLSTDSNFSIGAPTRLYFGSSGYYFAGGSFTFSNTNNTGGRFWLGLKHSSAAGDLLAYRGANEVHLLPSKSVNLGVSTGMFYAEAGSYLELAIYHDQAGPRNGAAASLTTQNNCNLWLFMVPWMTEVGPEGEAP